MSDFSGLPLVIEPSDLLPRLDASELILVDLTSPARYAEGHLPGARFVDPKRTQLGHTPAPGLLPGISGPEPGAKSKIKPLLPEQQSIPDHPLLTALKNLDANAITPLDALKLLSEWKQQAATIT